MRKALTLVGVVLLSATLLAAQTAAPADTAPAREHCIGDPNAPLVLEVFSDFQCPSCRQYFLGTIQPLLAEYVSAGSVCLIYRDLPLAAHQHARQAALYAGAAARNGHWFQAFGALYTFQEEWSKDGNIEAVLARALPGKTMTQVRRAMKDPKLAAAIDRDLERARRLGIRATPTSLLTVNGRTERFNGVVSYPILKRYLDHLLGK